MLMGSYDYRLVVLSVLTAMLASYTALDLAGRVGRGKGLSGRLWLLFGSLAMGAGVWSMHFVGMLAFSLPIPLGYDLPITLLSMLVAVVVAGFALRLLRADTLPWGDLALASLLLGLGIAGMHYSGMEAMRMQPSIRYDPWLVLASVLIAVAASALALWTGFRLKSARSWRDYVRRAAAAVIMGAAISGMHYTGMAAAHFPLDSVCRAAGLTDNLWLATTVALVTCSILIVTLAVSLMDALAESQTAKLNSSLSMANREINRLSLHDFLTGLPNRALLEDRLRQAIQEAVRERHFIAVLYLDLDGFKAVNDSLGHLAGDQVLKEAATRMAAVVRANDSLARIGGDEFVFVIGGLSNPQDAGLVCDKLLKAVAEPFLVQRQSVCLGASIGVSVYPNDGQDNRTLFLAADAALQHVKRSQKNDFQFFEPAMSTASHLTLRLQGELHAALSSRQFRLYFQPKFKADGLTLVGAEALIRWQHPDGRLRLPGEFIPLAERNGLIVAIGAWVLEEACRVLADWRRQGLGHLHLAVNLSARQFRQNDLLPFISTLCERYPFEPRNLVLEITESVAMNDAAQSVDIMRALRERGFRLSIDDFGTGYSSLSYLNRFPVGELKIDRSFVRDAPEHAENRAVIEAVLALGRALNLNVVAEGVETEAQHRLLSEAGCPELQGYLFGRPMPQEPFERLARA